MRGHLQQGRRELVAGWLLAAVATAVYLLTMSRTVDWWDCGEFIATSYLLQVGHPPGAPFYQLLAHCMTMLSFGHPLWVAPLSNALSALCGGIRGCLRRLGFGNYILLTVKSPGVILHICHNNILLFKVADSLINILGNKNCKSYYNHTGNKYAYRSQGHKPVDPSIFYTLTG